MVSQRPGKNEIDHYIMNRVRDLRITKGISQAELASLMDVSRAFIGKIENPKLDKKYNINHLNQLAKIFNCSPKDFLPDKPI